MAAQKLNILHIDTEKYWRGGQQQVFYLHKGLVEKKLNSILVCNKSSELKKRCRTEKLPYLEINMLGEIDFLSAFKIALVCKKIKVDIIHAHSAHALSIGIMVKLFYPSTFLLGVRRVDFPIHKNFLSQRKYNSRKIDRIICISDFIKSVLINDGIDINKLVTIRSGVDIHKFDNVIPNPDFRKNLRVQPNEFLVGTVAAFAGHKDYPNLLNAFKMVVEKINYVKLCMVGTGPLLNAMRLMVAELGLESKIIFTGFREDVGNFLKSFDLFVLASKKEGLGTSIIDALSVGLPIIATNTGGIPELITDNVNGKLVEPRNPSQLAETIIKLIEDSELRKKIKKKALSTAQNYSIENTIEQNLSLYKAMFK